MRLRFTVAVATLPLASSIQPEARAGATAQSVLRVHPALESPRSRGVSLTIRFRNLMFKYDVQADDTFGNRVLVNMSSDKAPYAECRVLTRCNGLAY